MAQDLALPSREALIALIREAGAAILELYRETSAFDTKADGSPVTAADLRSHQILTRGLAALMSVPVLSEEQPVAFEVRSTWPAFWLVDPLDGTKDYLARNDEFTINVALIEGEAPRLGVIYAPALDELYFAERGAGAFEVRGGEWVRLPFPGAWRERRMAVSRFHDVPAAHAFAQSNGIVAQERIGSALKFGRLARGDVSVYPRFAGTSEWDIAAGHCIVEAAGCRIVDLQTHAAPRYNKPSLLNAHFIVLAPIIDFSTLQPP